MTAATAALAVALTALFAAIPAAAFGSVSVTPGVVGYGTVHVNATTPPADCTSSSSNPGGTAANPNGGTESDCAAFDATAYDSCTTPDSDGSYSCSITLSAQAPAGWAFDHWSGDCSGTTTSCELPTTDTSCDPLVKPPCHTTSSGPYSAVAHFVDTRAPTTTLTQAPTSNSVVYSDTRSQQFSFQTDEGNEAPSYQCQLDGGSYFACASGFTWSSIADGVHTFCVRANDASGLAGGSACGHWEQETNPTVAIASHPAATDKLPADFSYSSNKSTHPADGSTLSYECALDSGAFAACPASGESYSSLPDGEHTFKVKALFHGALDPNGVVRESLATYTWTVDDTGPAIAFSSGPADGATLDGGSATWSWTADEPATFQCRVYPAAGAAPAYGACSGTSSHSVTGMAPGTYRLDVVGTDGVGNVGATASRTFTVPAPTTPGGGNGSTPGSGTPGSGTPASQGSGGAAAVNAKLAAQWRVRGGRTTVRRLRVTGIPAGGRATVSCAYKHRGCAFLKRARAFTASGGVADLRRAFRKPLRAGTVITVTVSAPGLRSKVFVITVKRRGKPSVAAH